MKNAHSKGAVRAHRKTEDHPAIIEILESRIAPATFVVTTLKDITDDAHDTGSFRDAIFQANASVGTDTIEFHPLPTNPAPLTGTILLGSDLPQITDSVIIHGSGATKLKIDGGGKHAIFNLVPNGGNLDVSLSGLTITKGLAPNGGGLYMNATGGKLT